MPYIEQFYLRWQIAAKALMAVSPEGWCVAEAKNHGDKKAEEYKLPKKIKRLARRSILSEKLQNEQIIVLNEFGIDEPKTKKIKELLVNLDIQENKILILTGDLTDDLILSMRNIPNIALLDAMTASTYDLLDSEVILFDQKGLKMLNDGLADK